MRIAVLADNVIKCLIPFVCITYYSRNYLNLYRTIREQSLSKNSDFVIARLDQEIQNTLNVMDSGSSPE